MDPLKKAENTRISQCLSKFWACLRDVEGAWATNMWPLKDVKGLGEALIALEDVSPGDQITVSYLSPLAQSSRARRPLGHDELLEPLKQRRERLQERRRPQIGNRFLESSFESGLARL